MSQSQEQGSAAGRRRFLQLVGMAGLASAIQPGLSLAQSRTPEVPKTPTAPDSVRTAPQQPAAISEEARILAGLIERRYGKHLNPEQLEAVTREIDNRLQGGKRLRESKLANGDEPDVVFRP